jgi:hypothetical protein
MGTLFVDRLMDFICLGLVIGLAFIFEGQTILDFMQQYRSGRGQSSGISLWQVSFCLLAAGALVVLIFRKRLMGLALVLKIIALLKGFWEGLKSVFRLKNPALFLLYSAGIWVMFFFQCWLNLKAFPPTEHLSASAALMVFVFGTLGFVIPSPGGMGTFHVLCIAGLALYGINGGDAFSYANIAFFTIQIFYNIVAGGLALLLLPILNRIKPEGAPLT